MPSIRSKAFQDGPRPATVAAWRAASKPQGYVAASISTLEPEVSRNSLNAFITPSLDLAREQAEQSDEILRGSGQRALEGLPIAVKDNYCTAGVRTTAGSNILRNFIPPYESKVTSLLLDAGAVLLGKTNMDEFAMGSSTETSAYGPTINPRGISLGNSSYVPGGSSGGSAAAVAAKLCLAALGTDTGGSIRQPASYCGVVGFKPTYGLCSRRGIIAYASSLDQAGVITNTAKDAAIMMDVIAVHDELDSTSLEDLIREKHGAHEFEKQFNADIGTPVIGIPSQFRNLKSNENLDALWAEIERRVRESGAKLVEVDIPHIGYSLMAYYIIALCEASSNLARYDGVRFGYRAPKFRNIEEMYELTRGQGFGPEVQRRILMGTYALSSGYYDQYYLRATKVRRIISTEISELFKRVNFLVWPTTPSPAFEIGKYVADTVSMYLEDVFTVPVNLVGLPAISIPGTLASNRMPMGFQVIGPRLSDAKLLSFAGALERLAPE